jgi:hypothetical protein
MSSGDRIRIEVSDLKADSKYFAKFDEILEENGFYKCETKELHVSFNEKPYLKTITWEERGTELSSEGIFSCFYLYLKSEQFYIHTDMFYDDNIILYNIELHPPFALDQYNDDRGLCFSLRLETLSYSLHSEYKAKKTSAFNDFTSEKNLSPFFSFTKDKKETWKNINLANTFK